MQLFIIFSLVLLLSSSSYALTIDAVKPSIISLIGSNVTMIVSPTDPRIQSHTFEVFVDDRKVPVISATSYFSGGYKLLFDTLTLTRNGYVILKVIDLADNSTETNSDLLYATEDCPEEGQYGRGRNCRECPSHATCPGGSRFWPDYGYWAAGEGADNIYKCYPTRSCTGIKTSLCASGYTGHLCGTCENKHYRLNGNSCVMCPKSSWGRLFVQIVLFLIMGAVSTVLPSWQAPAHIIAGVRDFQLLSGLGFAMNGTAVGQAVTSVTNAILAEFSVDARSILPECLKNSPMSYQAQFFLQLFYPLLLLTPIVVGLFVSRNKWGSSARFQDAKWVVIVLVYIPITAAACAILSCYRATNMFGRSLHLMSEPGVRCWYHGHVGYAILAIVLLAIVTVGAPISIWRALNSGRAEESMFLREITGYRWWAADFALSAFVSAAPGFLALSNIFRLLLGLVLIGLKIAALVIEKRFSARTVSQGLLVLIMFCQLIFATHIGRYLETEENAHTNVFGPIYLIMVIAFVVAKIVEAVYSARAPPPPAMRDGIPARSEFTQF